MGFVVGMSIVVMCGEWVVYVGSFGVVDIDSGCCVDEYICFYIVFIIKVFIVIVVLL